MSTKISLLMGLLLAVAIAAAGLLISDTRPAATAAGADRSVKLEPRLRNLEDDRGEAFKDGCHMKGTPKTRPPVRKCVYGDRSSKTTIVNIGDSHGLMYAPTVIGLARKRGWRALNLTRAGCTIADVDYKGPCNAWRRKVMRLIDRANADVVFVSNGTQGDYRVRVDGRRLSERASLEHLEDGLVRTLRRLRRTGAKVVVLRDTPRAPFYDMVDCLREHRDDLAECAFGPDRPRRRAFDARAARRVKGAKLADPRPVLCSKRRCPAVVDGTVVWRNGYHLSATFAETLVPWLESELPRALQRR